MVKQTAWSGVGAFLAGNWLALTLTALMGVLIVAMSFMLAAPGLTAREVGLITFILTAASSVASVLVTHIYSESASSRSLRDHGVQIASGIMVLKRQIEGLSEWVEDKRSQVQRAGGGQHPDAVLEHVEETLAGFTQMTDAALGGIGGVIGDAIAQYEAVMGQISNTRAEASRKTSQIEREMEEAQSSTEVARLSAQIDEIANTTERRIAELARTSALPIPTQPSRRQIAVACPHCGTEQKLEILDRAGETRTRHCPSCSGSFNVHLAVGRVLTRPHGPIRTSPVQSAARPAEGVEEIRAYVRKLFIEPADLKRIIDAIVQLDRGAKVAGLPTSPSVLEQNTLASQDLHNAGVSRIKIRSFFFYVYKSKAFEFAFGAIGYTSPYVNVLTEEGLLAAYVRSYVWALSARVHVKPDDARGLAEALLQPAFSYGEAVFSKAIAELPPDRAPETELATHGAAPSSPRLPDAGPLTGAATTPKI